MTGLLQEVLTNRYGPAELVHSDGIPEARWLSGEPERKSVLYLGMQWDDPTKARYSGNHSLYGNAIGGFLIGGSLKVATLGGHNIYGLYTVEELSAQPEVQSALELQSDVSFFMDAANVWFYGHKKGKLYVFDAETGELDELGPLASELERVILDWEQTSREAR
jgi:hypothetical protein